MDISSAIKFLNENNGALQAIFSAVLALVTTVYAFVTVLLWWATRTQADISKKIFEATHRPWLKITMKPWNWSQPDLPITLLVENEGSVEARITKWDVSLERYFAGFEGPVKLADDGKDIVNIVLPPGDDCTVDVKVAPDISLLVQVGAIVDLKVTAHYEGAAQSKYWSSLKAKEIYPQEPKQRRQYGSS